MVAMQKTIIVVPCYNEAARLNGNAFLSLVRTESGLSFIFVNDGSRDGTLKKIEEMSSKEPGHIHVINLSKNVGKAEAVRLGMLEALKEDAVFAGYWDADLAAPLSEIENLCRLFTCPDVIAVFGSRVKLLGKKIERRAVRHYLGRVFATLVSMILRLPVYDTQCGAKMFRNTETVRILFNKPFRVNWSFDVEVLARLKLLAESGRSVPVASSVFECPLNEWGEVHGSKIKTKDFFSMAAELVKIALFLYVPFLKRRYAATVGL